LGEVAGLLAAIALLLLVGVVALPLFKMAKILDEMRETLRQMTEATMPIMTELEGTVSATKDELVKLAVVTEDVATVSARASETATTVSRVTTIISQSMVVPFIKFAALAAASRRALQGVRKK